MNDCLTCLLVDDELMDAEILGWVIKRSQLPISLSHIDDSEQALHHLKAKQLQNALPDVVLVDVNMPDVTGIEFISLVRSEQSLDGLPVYAFTSSKRPDDRKRAIDAGATGFLSKSRLNDDVTALKELLELHGHS